MTLQTDQPLARVTLDASNRPAWWFDSLRKANTEHDDVHRGGLDLDAPYQRGEVWTVDQQRLLIKSFLMGVPIPAVIVNDRYAGKFRHPDGTEDWRYAVVDGKQRVTACLAWFDAILDVPASWFDPDWVASTRPTGDGPYVTITDLTEVGARFARGSRMLLPVLEGKLSSLQAEAELYLLLNRGGTAHTDADLEPARRLAT